MALVDLPDFRRARARGKNKNMIRPLARILGLLVYRSFVPYVRACSGAAAVCITMAAPPVTTDMSEADRYDGLFAVGGLVVAGVRFFYFYT